MTTFEEAYTEIGDYFTSKIPKDASKELAQSIANALAEQFQDFRLRLTIVEKPQGLALEMGLNGDLLLPLLQEVRRLRMEVTSLNSVWGSA
jgi:predicted RNA-binding protein (virulence factor B family)